jgi:hypothetical protein
MDFQKEHMEDEKKWKRAIKQGIWAQTVTVYPETVNVI